MATVDVILVEDDEHKLKQILSFVQYEFPQIDISVYRSFHSGLDAILSRRVDLILLDMTLTTFDISDEEEGGRPRPYGGREILEHMQEGGLSTPIIVVTQYVSFGTPGDKRTLPELDRTLNADFPNLYFGCVYYDIGAESWKENLKQMIQVQLREVR